MPEGMYKHNKAKVIIKRNKIYAYLSPIVSQAVRHTTRSGYIPKITQIGVPYLDQDTYPENSIKEVWNFFLLILVVKPSNVCRKKNTQ